MQKQKQTLGLKEIMVKALGYHCERCGEDIKLKNPERMPIACARCKSPYWRIPRKQKGNVNPISQKPINIGPKRTIVKTDSVDWKEGV